ncbi:hypothetical protein ABEB36_003444 [Hypothenemus hampei]|uniref:Uncharacterized protein n=1 Tax=Hypothenemus hampei TaxID=57062 RepID=A0ABD1F960_HYPHA
MDTNCKKEISNLCRTCMASNVPTTSLFSILSFSNKEEPLNSILYKCTSIQVHNTDILPQNICSSCLEKLAICYLFRELCFDTEARLQHLYFSQNTTENFAVGTLTEQVSSLTTSLETGNSCETTFKTHYELFGVDTIDEPQLNISDTNLTVEEKNLEQNCDTENLGCENQNSYHVSKDKKLTSTEFSCDICSKNYSSKYSLTRHLKVHSDAEELKCQVCFKTFSRAADVKRHLTAHTGEKPYTCNICSCSFTQSGRLAAHMRQKHKIERREKPPVHQSQEKPYLCSTCGKCFRHSSTLKMHLRRHLGIKPYECQTCKLKFVSSGRLKSHVRVHTGERPFTCHICNNSFAQSTVLSRHLKSHADVKPHQCSYCPKRFHIPYYLNIHLRQHSGEKPFVCSTCGNRFVCSKTLKQHKKIHTGEKPYSCIKCGKSFRRTQHLKVHMKLHGTFGSS